MFTYPQLTPTEQADLPKLIALPIAMPSKFDDSTHQLWHCKTGQGDMVLKVCNDNTIANSDFWLGINHLFAAGFPNSLGNIHLTHDFLAQNGGLNVPDFVAASANRFVLTRFLPGVDLGVDLEIAQVDDQWVVQLAKHIARLHQCTYTQWGNLHAPQFSAKDWAERLHATCIYLARQRGMPMAEPLLRELLAQANWAHETEFVPIMLDLRWDQLRRLSGFEMPETLALIDLDAFVIGPKSLELVLLSHLLTPTQFALFKQHYVTVHPWPDYAQQKPCYQLLLFLLHVLGETDLARWLTQSCD